MKFITIATLIALAAAVPAYVKPPCPDEIAETTADVKDVNSVAAQVETTPYAEDAQTEEDVQDDIVYAADTAAATPCTDEVTKGEDETQNSFADIPVATPCVDEATEQVVDDKYEDAATVTEEKYEEAAPVDGVTYVQEDSEPETGVKTDVKPPCEETKPTGEYAYQPTNEEEKDVVVEEKPKEKPAYGTDATVPIDEQTEPTDEEPPAYGVEEQTKPTDEKKPVYGGEKQTEQIDEEKPVVKHKCHKKTYGAPVDEETKAAEEETHSYGEEETKPINEDTPDYGGDAIEPTYETTEPTFETTEPTTDDTYAGKDEETKPADDVKVPCPDKQEPVIDGAYEGTDPVTDGTYEITDPVTDGTYEITDPVTEGTNDAAQPIGSYEADSEPVEEIPCTTDEAVEPVEETTPTYDAAQPTATYEADSEPVEGAPFTTGEAVEPVETTTSTVSPQEAQEAVISLKSLLASFPKTTQSPEEYYN